MSRAGMGVRRLLGARSQDRSAPLRRGLERAATGRLLLRSDAHAGPRQGRGFARARLGEGCSPVDHRPPGRRGLSCLCPRRGSAVGGGLPGPARRRGDGGGGGLQPPERRLRRGAAPDLRYRGPPDRPVHGKEARGAGAAGERGPDPLGPRQHARGPDRGERGEPDRGGQSRGRAHLRISGPRDGGPEPQDAPAPGSHGQRGELSAGRPEAVHGTGHDLGGPPEERRPLPLRAEPLRVHDRVGPPFRRARARRERAAGSGPHEEGVRGHRAAAP